MKHKSIWDEFTKQYKISKTLRFELKPVGKTEENIKDNIISAQWQNGKNILAGEDSIKAEHYKIVKNLLNKLHQLFINETLSNESISLFDKDIKKINNKKKKPFKEQLNLHYDLWQLYNQNKEDKNEKLLKNSKNQLYKLIGEILNQTGDRWKLEFVDFYKQKNQTVDDNKNKIPKISKSGSAIMYGSTSDSIKFLKYQIDLGNIDLLKSEKDSINYTKNEMLEFVDTFDKFYSYFTGFNENRSNVYNVKDEISTSIAYRLFDQNIEFFFENIRRWEIFNNSLKNKEIKENLKIKKWDVKQKIQEIEEKLVHHNFKSNLAKIFKPEKFIEILSQKGIDSYNEILGGIPAEIGQPKIQGLNEIINLTRQQVYGDKRHFPAMHILYKQILSENNNSFIDVFNDDEELLSAVKEFKESIENNKIRDLSFNKKERVLEQIVREIDNLVDELNEKEELKEEYYLSEKAIQNLSIEVIGGYDTIHKLWYEHIDSLTNNKGKALTKKDKDKFKKQKYLSYKIVEDLIKDRIKDDEDFLKPEWKNNNELKFSLLNYFKIKLNQFVKDGKKYSIIKKDGEEKEIKVLSIEQVAENDGFKKILNELSFGNNKKDGVEQLKDYFDACINLYHFIKSFQIKTSDLKEDQNRDTSSIFQSNIGNWLEDEFDMVQLYNKVRNYVTKKPYSTEKIKLNFESSHLLTGWAQDYTTKGALIFFKDEQYYLGIIKKSLTPEDKMKLQKNANHNLAKRIIYDFQKPDNKNIPRIFIRSKGDNFSPAVKKYNLPVESILDIYDNNKFKTDFRKENPYEYKKSLAKLIDYFKIGFESHESYSHYHYNFKPSNQYKDISEFYRDAIGSCYQLFEEEINFDTLLEYTSQGKLYLFQIYNKDFSRNKKNKGRDNLHTSYWKMLFHPENLKDVVAKLNGQAEIFFRPASIKKDKAVVHEKNKPIPSKRDETQFNNFKYDIIKDRRFTEDKYLFHTPITLNFKQGENHYINNDINDFLADNPDVNIIGIDRGEKHLLYYTLINQDGDILEQESLNVIKSSYKKDSRDVKFETPYHSILDKKEKERDAARKSWQSVENIKELKAGYLSHVVHKLAELIIKHNAIVVLEDLNFGFKRGRFKVEKQVYQKFERALIEKLNYLVFKDRDFGESGHYLNAFQLTGKFESFQKLRKQTGILFYTTASYTSKVDPVTGYMQNLYHKFDKTKTYDFYEKFDSIIFNGEYFEFTYDLKKIQNEPEHGFPVKTNWTVASCVTRSKYDSKNKNSKILKINDELLSLFRNADIKFQDNINLINIILEQDDKFLRSFHYLFTLILGMRVVDRRESTGTDENDYILSPVKPFYNSKEISDNLLPTNGDANGAYNIARKGKIILDKISLRKAIEQFYLKEDMIKEGKRIEWNKLGTSIAKIKNKKNIDTIFVKWTVITGRKLNDGSNVFNGKELTSEGKLFVKYIESLTVSKLDWQNYAGREDIVKKQISKMNK